jgi:uncharacterized glyoxalase superfamily protein PhnB
MESTTEIYKLKQPIPVFQVKDVQAAVDFYVENLGFERPWVHEGHYGGAEKNGGLIHFMKKDAPNEMMVYYYVEGVDALYESAKERGLTISSELTDTTYGMREFTARDLDGNYLVFGQTGQQS